MQNISFHASVVPLSMQLELRFNDTRLRFVRFDGPYCVTKDFTCAAVALKLRLPLFVLSFSTLLLFFSQSSFFFIERLSYPYFDLTKFFIFNISSPILG